MWLVFIFLINTGLRTQNHSFKGRVIENDEYKTPLYGATVWFPDLEKGEVTNLSGYFSFDDIPEGTHRLRISFVGYKTKEVTVQIPPEEEPVYALEVDPQELEAIEVTAEGGESVQVQQARLSTINVTSLPLSTIPRLMGEPDLIRIIQNLPGVKTESDFTGGFHVRGGRNDQNLILLDGVQVYNPWHLFGLFSAFNTEAIESVELTKGVFPASFGSRVSSVLDIDLQEGSERLGGGYLTVSPLSGSFSYGRPVNQNTSYLISLRRTYMDPIFWIVNRSLKKENEFEKESESLGYNFFDLNLKLEHRFSRRLSLETAYYRSSDWFDDTFKYEEKDESNEIYREKLKVGWKNHTASVKLSYQTPTFVSETQPFITFYDSNNRLFEKEENLSDTSEDNLYRITSTRKEQRFDQKFRDSGVKQDFTFFPGDHSSIYAGVFWQLHNFQDLSIYKHSENGYVLPPNWNSGIPVPEGDSRRITTQSEGDSLSVYAHEMGAYLSASVNVGDWSFHPGVRYEYYNAGGYHSVMPRMNVSWQATPKLMITAGYGLFSQYIHVLGLDLVRAPTDRWFWSDEKRETIRAKMATLGVGYDVGNAGSLSVEGYYKTMDNLLNFDPQSQIEALENVNFLPKFGSETLSGSGESYGAELFWEKKTGPITGWMGYTLSWTWNQFDGLNNGNRFPGRTDKRHDIQLFMNWDFAENWSLGALFNYKSGQPVTFSTGHYLVKDDPLGIGERSSPGSQVIKSMNNFRMPDYHRLDLNLTWKNRSFFKQQTEFSLNVVNVYNHINVLTVITSTAVIELGEDKIRVIPEDKYVSQLPIIPVFSMRIALGGDAK